ncbi:helix-turn-helix domain-containing protein [Enterococcus rivorum]|uniref:Mga helix-turn-helix domain-containing protein n=1 Tax=Enterococcus rivorum TaxID=762845 RepID=A0A1E5KS46_9ENTE|nr:helix-turn-helix domain-containing protein [Enterococcus rivorum]MBP2097354.1 hypothetical protein [Enterococcus rivorum]OEH80705.1 hypothetical protein BCR26_06790 [Enterococcus rivorum]
MYTKFLSLSKQNELSIFYSIIQAKQTLDSLSTYLTIPKSTVKKHIQKLNLTLKDKFPKSTFIQSNKKGEYVIASEFTENKLLIFHQLKLDYLKVSPNFQLLVLLTTNFSQSYLEVTDKLFVTFSYLSRIVKGLNEELKKFELEIQLSKNTLTLSGNELSIRVFSFLFLNKNFQTLEWPFVHLTRDDLTPAISPYLLDKSLTESKSTTNSFYFWFAVSTLRIQNQLFINKQDNETTSILNLVERCYDIPSIFNFQPFGDFPEDVIKNEILFFSYFTNVLFPHIVVFEKKVALGEKFLQQRNPATTFSKQLMHSFKQTFGITPKNDVQALFIYFFTLTYLNFKLLGDNAQLFINLYFPRLNYSLPDNNQKSIEVQQFFNNFLVNYLQENQDEQKKSDSFKEIYYSLVYRLLFMSRKPQLFVYVQVTKDFTGSSYIRKQLADIFSDEVVIITKNIHQADLIISDTLETSRNGKRLFVLSSLKSYSQWMEISQVIQQLILQKLFIEEEQ